MTIETVGKCIINKRGILNAISKMNNVISIPVDEKFPIDSINTLVHCSRFTVNILNNAITLYHDVHGNFVRDEEGKNSIFMIHFKQWLISQCGCTQDQVDDIKYHSGISGWNYSSFGCGEKFLKSPIFMFT